MAREDEIKQGLNEHTIAGHAKDVKALTEEGLALGMQPLDMLFGALIPALQEVGRRFEKGEYFVPEMLMSAKAMGEALKLLRPILAQTGAKPVAKVIMLTVKGDLHDIGKNLCDMMLEGAGFEVIDLGTNVPPEKFIAAVKQHQPQLVGFSAFLTTTMPMFKVNIELLAKEGLRDKVKVMVGGAPVNQAYTDRVGADGYAPDASSTVRLAKKLLQDMGYDANAGSEAKAEVVATIDAMEKLMEQVGQAEAKQASEQ
ncbi:MAG: corrinoid protein [Chloroflexi bacterium]|nr:corrinoid protein [Chloroflexota bacterium]